MSRIRSPYFLLGGLLILGAVVRLVYFWQLKDTALAQVPLLDSQTYHNWAVSLVAGDWGWNQTYWMGPLYPHLLAVVYWIFGVGSQAALLLQLALSLLNVGLVFLLARRLTDQPYCALLAAFLFSLYGAPVFYAGMLLMATVVTTLYLWVALQTEKAARRPTTGNWIVLGLLVGLTGLARGNALLLLATLPVLLWKATTATTTPGRRRLTAAMILAGLVTLLPVTARNLIVADDFVLLTSNGGVNLLIGQQVDYKGIFAPVMDEPEAELDPSLETNLERELGRDLKGSEVSRILTRRAFDEFTANLGAMPLHYLRKAYRFWNGYELPQIVSYDYWRGQFGALQPLVLPYFLLSALGLLGLRFLPHRARWIMIILLGTYFLSLLPFFPTSRYRQPVAPLLAMSSAVFLTAMLRQPGRCQVWLPAALLLSLALLPRWAALPRAEVEWQVHLHEASRASKLGDLKTTLAKGRQAEESRPDLPDTPFHLSLYLEDLGAHQEALAALRLAQIRAPRNRLIPYKIGRNYEDMGRYPEAVAAYDEAAALAPDWPYPWLRLGLVYRQMGQKELALQALVKALELGPGNHRVRANLASAYAEAGQNEKARAMLQELTRDYPFYLNGWFNLALVELRAGNADAAEAALDQGARLPHLTSQQKQQVAELRRTIQRVRGR